MNSKIERPCETMSVDDLHAEFKRLKDNLQDLEETHAFTFGKTTVHIGADQAQSMQEEYEEECRQYNARIVNYRRDPESKGGMTPGSLWRVSKLHAYMGSSVSNSACRNSQIMVSIALTSGTNSLLEGD